jgi:hypothetical protein
LAVNRPSSREEAQLVVERQLEPVTLSRPCVSVMKASRAVGRPI